MRSFLVLLLVFVITVTAQPGSGDPGTTAKDKKAPVGRNLNVAMGTHGVTVTAKGKTAEVRNMLKLQFTTNGFPRFRTSFFSASADAKAAFKFRAGVLKIIEFTDANNDCYSTGETIHKTIKLFGGSTGSAVWGNMMQNPASVGGVTYQNFTTKAVVGGTTIILSAFTAPSAVKAPAVNATVRPDAFKFGLEIRDWQFQTTGSKLGVVMVFEGANTFRKMNGETSQGDKEVAVGNGGSIEWKPVVEAKNASSSHLTPVSSSGLLDGNTVTTPGDDGSNTFSGDDGKEAGETAKRMVFCFDTTDHNQTHFMWDPSIGLDEDALAVSPAYSAPASFVIIAVCVALLALIF